MKIGVYPGSFDPVTFGHIDVIKRASKMFDKIIVLVMYNSAKASPLFSKDERVNMIREATKDLDNVIVESYDGLTIDYCKAKDIHIIVRGLRAITDFEYELQIAQTNTVFLTTSIRYSYLSSSTVREIASYNGDIYPCVPGFVAKAVYEKFGFDHIEQGDM